jgi:predicted MFS family arabinose efflux permease
MAAVLGVRYARILRAPRTARLLLPTLIARIPDAIAATAIAVLVRSVTGSFSTAGFAAGAFGIGTAVSAPLAGRALDRFGQRRVLPVLALAFAGLLVTLTAGTGHLSYAAIDALAAAAGLTRPPVEAAMRAVWPQVVPASAVDTAYALDSTTQELIWIGGPLLLAGLLATGSARLPLLACAVVSAGGTALYAMGLPGTADRRPGPGSHPGPLRQARLRVLLLSALGYGLAAGVLNLALIAFATRHGGVAWAGILVAVWGCGSLAGGLIYGSRDWPATVELRAMACLALFGAALALLAAAPGLAVLTVLMVPLGLPLSPWLGSLSSAVQRSVPGASTTEAFAWLFAVITVGIAAGNAAGGVLIQAAGTRTAFLAAAALSLAGALSGVLLGAGPGAQLLPARGHEGSGPRRSQDRRRAGEWSSVAVLARAAARPALGSPRRHSHV